MAKDLYDSYPEVKDSYFLRDVITDFFKHYNSAKIYDGSASKIAIYFPKIADLADAKPVVEKSLMKLGLDPSVILEVHNKSKQETRDLFDNRINDPRLPYRVFLLVNKGTEGWNCPSLFSTALARRLVTGNNFCLQAASLWRKQFGCHAGGKNDVLFDSVYFHVHRVEGQPVYHLKDTVYFRASNSGFLYRDLIGKENQPCDGKLETYS